MIDAEKMPIHNYHGSSKGITIFYNPIEDPNYYRHGRLAYGISSKNRKGIYFTVDKDVAKQYKKWKNGKIYDVYLNFEKPYVQSYKDTGKQLWYNILHPFKQKYRLDPGNIRPKDFKFLSSYDSVIHTDAENIALKSNQIKLADAVTYDDNGIRIPLGLRDNFKSKDIRYGLIPLTIGGTALSSQYADGGSIHISPSKRGTFTAAATKHGIGVQEFASKVLTNKDNYSPTMVKKANFAKNASKWKHGLGGYLVK